LDLRIINAFQQSIFLKKPRTPSSETLRSSVRPQEICLRQYNKGEPEIDWRKITGLRNILIHEYFGINKYKASGRSSGAFY